MNEQEENISLTKNSKNKNNLEFETDSDSEIINNDLPMAKPKKKVRFKKADEDEDIHVKSKKRKVLESTVLDNTENIAKPNEGTKAKKAKVDDSHENINEEENHDESHANDTIDWPQNDLRTLVKNIEQALPEKDNLAFQTRADKLNWDDIAFDKYTGDDCKKTWFLIQKRIRRFRLLSELLQDAKEWISKPWTHFYRGTKTNRHPDLPKRPLSGYMLFYVKKKDKLLAEFPGLEMTEVSKRMALMYKNLSTEKREKYMQLAIAERKAYEEKMEEFHRLHPDIPRISEKSNHSKTIDLGPKKPTTPFSLFFKEQLKNFHSDSEIDRNTFKEQCKEQWRGMSEKKKVVWIDLSLEQEEKYQEELKNYVIQNPNFVITPFKTVVSKEERAIKERLAGKPVKPPNSAYSLFSQMMLKSEDIKKIDPKGRMKALADHWKNSSDEEKKVYQEHCEQLMAQYKIDFATYLDSLPENKRQEELQNTQPKRKIKKTEEIKNKPEEDKNKNDSRKNKNDEKSKDDEKNVKEKDDKNTKEREERTRSEKSKLEEKNKTLEKIVQEVPPPAVEEVEDKKVEETDRSWNNRREQRRIQNEHKQQEEEPPQVEEPVKKETKSKKGSSKQGSNKKKKKKKSRSNNGHISLTKILDAEPAHPPVSGFALFSKRYHGKAPVETAWKNLNKLEKKEYETEVQMLKKEYIKQYEQFLKSLSKEQLTAFSKMKKVESKIKDEKVSHSEDEFDEENTDASE